MRPRPALPRRLDWQSRLHVHFDAKRREPCVYGINDCVLFAADAVLAVTGRDPIADWRGQWQDEDSAWRLIGEDGLEARVVAAMAAFGAPECPPLFAQRGDVCLAVQGNDLVVAVMMSGQAWAPSALGLRAIPLGERIIRAWSI